jgi:hypothetical protein
MNFYSHSVIRFTRIESKNVTKVEACVEDLFGQSTILRFLI